MAAPLEKTIKDMNGRWAMNKAKCNDFDSVLQLQGIGWLTRKTIASVGITVTIKQYVDEQGVDHLDLEQHLAGGTIQSTPEPRAFDWGVRPHSDSVFGELEGRSRYVDSKTLEEGYGKDDIAFLSEGWDSPEQIQSWVENKKSGWTGNQIWGFQLVDGERRYVRKAVVRKKNEVKTAFLVYDYLGA